jgi:hypothetical protein
VITLSGTHIIIFFVHCVKNINFKITILLHFIFELEAITTMTTVGTRTARAAKKPPQVRQE